MRKTLTEGTVEDVWLYAYGKKRGKLLAMSRNVRVCRDSRMKSAMFSILHEKASQNTEDCGRVSFAITRVDYPNR